MRKLIHWLLILLTAGMLAACNEEVEESTLYVSFTDADGDFLVYNVNVTGLSLVRGDGTRVELISQSSELDFAQYVELSELFTAAQVPKGSYVGGSITLDYAGADIQVEHNGAAVPATVVDEAGNPVSTLTLDLAFGENNELIVRPGSPALLELDFDLEASHVVNFDSTPVTATVTPVLYANASIEDGKPQRIRGPLASVNLEAGTYNIDLRPFHRRNGDFGNIRIHTSADTRFEIDGNVYTGADGLAALADKGPGTATVAIAELDAENRRFNASEVYAGSSVPGGDLDAATGVVTARDGDTLNLHGVMLVRSDGSVSFSDQLSVSLGPDTHVTKPVQGEDQLDKDAISVGQKITVFGTADDLNLDASQGWVRLGFTHLDATLIMVNGEELLLDLQSINRRRVDRFDFSGTGISPAEDADPANYQVAAAGLPLAGLEGGEPVRVSGFVSAFGAAPPDFEAWAVANFESARAVLDITWDGSTAAFLSLGEDGIVPNLDDPLLGERHHLRRGGVITDLSAAGSPLTVTGAGLGLYTLRTPQAVTVYASFSGFVGALAAELDGSRGVNRLHAIGGYDAESGILEARRLVVIIE